MWPNGDFRSLVAAIGVSYRDASGTNTMTESAAIDRPPKAGVSRPRSAKPRPSALAAHLDCSRTYIGKLGKVTALVITEPNNFVAEVHDRMPVILEKKDFEQWERGSAGGCGGADEACRRGRVAEMGGIKAGQQLADGRR
jgi:hypothetical protein